MLQNFLHDVPTAIRSHLFVCDIDQSLHAGDVHALMERSNMTHFEIMLTNDVKSMYEQWCTDSTFEAVFPQLESQLVVTHAKLITQLEKEISGYIQSKFAAAVSNCTKENLSRE